MIDIVDKRKCSGCGACINACPHDIIRFQEDAEGFMYPVVDADKCVNCHLCEKACPFLNDITSVTKVEEHYPRFYAGQLKNKDELMDVSSGGAFWAFAKAIIRQNGVVYGAVQRDVDNIIHFRGENIETVKKFRKSKYFQSDTELTFRQVKNDLKSNRLVLYSGTGCQITGLISYLGRDYENLYTCDVVCHGVPSRKVWNVYRKEKEEREGKVMTNLVFRDKSAGWSRNQYKITYQDGTIEKEASTRQLFHAGYLSGLFYRPSCGCCRFATLSRCSDVTLADYWKYTGRFHLPEKDLGVSLIMVNSTKGYRLLEYSSKYLMYEVTPRELALSSCRHLDEHPCENPKRTEFFQFFFEKGYFVAAENFLFTPKPILIRIKNKLKSLFKK